MNVVKLVKLKILLQGMSLQDLDHAIDYLKLQFQQIDNIADPPELDSYKLPFFNTIDDIKQSSLDINTSIDLLINKINQELEFITKDCLQRGYQINGNYGSALSDLNTERSRTLTLTEDQRILITNVARKYTDWHYPTLEIGPGDGTWTEHLVAGDPLYIVDIYKEFINNTLSKFNPLYQKRLRPYLLKAGIHDKFADLSMLPQQQFGFIFAWNVFNYLPLVETKSYLLESFKLLRPGGVMMFSYNNCNTVNGAGYFENGMRSWMTEDLLLATCKELGFNILNSVTEESDIHWVEICKPGLLKTVKAHQVLGKILPV